MGKMGGERKHRLELREIPRGGPMKPGDLVELDPEILWKGEPHIGIYWSDQVAFECDCLIYWNESSSHLKGMLESSG